ncbi:MAG: hypothetical protein ACI8U3_003036 [Brevundimonas sp.]|jgi:hypothetical protein|uniref:DUF3147 family protein n=1 Tax=Brevundimonas sp. TaxID=1871086 RepID=UPI0039E50867
MLYLIIKAAVSGVMIALGSEVARRYPGWGALIISLPLVSILGMIWLWRDTGDEARLADHAQATFWFVLPSLPMFLIVPALLRRGVAFWPALAFGCAVTLLLDAMMIQVFSRLGVRL